MFKKIETKLNKNNEYMTKL